MSHEEKNDGALTAPLSTASEAGQPTKQAPRRRVYLLVSHTNGVTAVPLVPGASVVIGREPPADLAIPDKNLSRQHARFTLVAAEEVAVEDLGSTNGTRVNDRRVEKEIIKPGVLVLLGSATASVHVAASDDARPLGLLSHDAFRGAVEAELERARFFGRSLAVLMVRPLDRQDGQGGGSMASWYPQARRLLRPVDRAALYGADRVEILVPEASSEEVLELARALADPSRSGAALGCGAAFFPGTASAEELIESSLDAARRATRAKPFQMAASEGHRTIRKDERAADDDGIVMDSPAMREVARIASRLLNAVIPVLIHGETGSGKEVLARLLHTNGPRRDKPLVSVNCAAIPAALLESTLFGHEKGAFTGADRQQKGLFEAADGGTILLDEIGELSPSAQAALLRVLEEKRVQRVGSTRPIDVDVRVLAATHRDLEAMCDAGTFRRDLLFRLNAVVLTLPPLRERRPDIAPLAARFLREASKANGREVQAISSEAMALLERYAWPGNVRELRNVIERAVVIAEESTITPEDLPPRLHGENGENGQKAPAAPSQARYKKGPLKDRVESFERDVILEALRESNGKLSEAARLLEVPLRTLQHKVNVLGIRRTLDYHAGDPDE